MIKITTLIRTALDNDPRTRFDEAHLLMCIYEMHGLNLTPDQKAMVASLPNPKSVIRIADREKKRLQGAVKKDDSHFQPH